MLKRTTTGQQNIEMLITLISSDNAETALKQLRPLLNTEIVALARSRDKDSPLVIQRLIKALTSSLCHPDTQVQAEALQILKKFYEHIELGKLLNIYSDRILKDVLQIYTLGMN